MMNKLLLIVGLILLIGGGIFFLNKSADKKQNPTLNTQTKVTIYKSPLCGCCVEHGAYLEKQDFDVEMVKIDNMDSIKRKYKISSEMQSCHTAVIGDYFVEGHVPVEAINKLLKEKPAIDGIALPEMPAGSPGMPGIKTEPFVIYAIKNGEASEFMTL